MKLHTLWILLLILPLASAINCELTQDEDFCNDVQNSNLTEAEKDVWYSYLLYNYTSPNHDFVKNYNDQIEVTSKPQGIRDKDSTQIKDAWISLLSISPSVYQNNELYVPSRINVRSEFRYRVFLPYDFTMGYRETKYGECKRRHELIRNVSSIRYYFNNRYIGQGKKLQFNVNSDGTIKTEARIDTRIRVDHYQWERHCSEFRRGQCDRYHYTCELHHTTQDSDSLRISDEKEVQLFNTRPSATVQVIDRDQNTTKGIFTANDYSYFELNFDESYIRSKNYVYSLVFEKKPYDIAYLKASYSPLISTSNLYLAGNTFFVKKANHCSIFAYNHFFTLNKDCEEDLQEEELGQLQVEERTADLTLLLYILMFLLICYLIYRLAKSQWQKVIPLVFILVFFVPLTLGAPVEPAEPIECGIMNLAECIPLKMYEYFLLIINAPLLPMLILIQSLLTADVHIELFIHLWAVIRYILSFFYVFFFVYAGYIFLVANANPIRRAKAKEMLRKESFQELKILQIL